MRWFRRNGGVAAWLACFALACQLMLTFGHVHIARFGSELAVSGAAQALSGKQARSEQAIQALSGEEGADWIPLPQGDPAGASADFCAICANITLAGSLILPVLLLILVPGLFIDVLPWPEAATSPGRRSREPFGARGPPNA